MAQLAYSWLVTCGSQLASGQARELLLCVYSVHRLTLPLSLGTHEPWWPAALASMGRALLAWDQSGSSLFQLCLGLCWILFCAYIVHGLQDSGAGLASSLPHNLGCLVLGDVCWVELNS